MLIIQKNKESPLPMRFLSKYNISRINHILFDNFQLKEYNVGFR